MQDHTRDRPLEHYFENKHAGTKDWLISVPIEDAVPLDGGKEMHIRLRSIMRNSRDYTDWLQIDAKTAERTSGGTDEFFLHKAAILADSINKDGLFAPVHVHWHYKQGQMRHPSNDKIAVICSGLVHSISKVRVLWREVSWHDELFPDHDFSGSNNWLMRYEKKLIDDDAKYKAMYRSGLDGSNLIFECANYRYIWENYPANVWGKLKPFYENYAGAHDFIAEKAKILDTTYVVGVVDSYHRKQMSSEHPTRKLGDIFSVGKHGIEMHTETVNKSWTWEELKIG